MALEETKETLDARMKDLGYMFLTVEPLRSLEFFLMKPFFLDVEHVRTFHSKPYRWRHRGHPTKAYREELPPKDIRVEQAFTDEGEPLPTERFCSVYVKE